MLSRDEAIKKHRGMWNWIAERIRESERVWDVDNLKQEYVKQHNECVMHNCYLCQYCIDKVAEDRWDERCKYCPLDWESSGDEDGLYQCLDDCECEGKSSGYYSIARITRITGNWEYQYELCKKIANLKEREIEGERNESSKSEE